MRTLSLGSWMQLADMPFEKWLDRQGRGRERRSEHDAQSNRPLVADVQKYYADYVKVNDLGKYFRNHSTVTMVQRVTETSVSDGGGVDCESGEQDAGLSRTAAGQRMWDVTGYHCMTDETGSTSYEEFCYRAPNVVLATGTFDLPNTLNVPGEQHPFVLHSTAELEDRICSGEVSADSDPVVVVGAGLSAADAILYARMYGIPIIHVFNRDSDDPNIVYRQLPGKLYPEYHEVHRLMQAGETDDGYRSYPTTSVVQFSEDREVFLRYQKCDSEVVVEVASFVVVLIGSCPNLSFLPGCGKNLGVVPGTAVHCKHNPIDIDPYTYECARQPGLYAMGPLVGDSFVRFLRGGGLGITAHLWQKRQELEEEQEMARCTL